MGGNNVPDQMTDEELEAQMLSGGQQPTGNDGNDGQPQNASQDDGNNGDDGTGNNGQDEGNDQDGDDNNQTPPDQGTQQNQGKQTPKSIQKLLSQRNEANVRVSELEQEKQQLEQRIKELSSKGELSDEEKQSLQDAKMDEKLNARDMAMERKLQEREQEREVSQFMSNHPELAGSKEEIKTAIKNNPNLSLDQIHNLWLMENDPQALSEKMGGQKKTYGIAGKSTSKSTSSTPDQMTDAQLEEQILSSHNSGGLTF